MRETETITLEINGRKREIAAAPNQTLLETLRENGYFEVKSGCEKGDCGACAVLLDGVAIDSCLTLTQTVAGRKITTVAGLCSSARDSFCSPSLLSTNATRMVLNDVVS